MNSSGVYVGSTVDNSNPGPFVYGGFVGTGTSATPLDYPGFPQTRGFGINDDGWITGIWDPGGFTRRGYVARGEEIYDLGLFPGHTETWVGAINNTRTIVGAAANFDYFERALIWRDGSLTPEDLNTLVNIPGVTLNWAIDINNAGQILVEGLSATGDRYYILTPIPEPTTVGVLFALALIARRRA